MSYPGRVLTGDAQFHEMEGHIIHKEQGESMKRIFSEMKSLRYALLAFAATALLLGGCSGGGGSDYDAPTSSVSSPTIPSDPADPNSAPYANTGVLIEAATLKEWVDAGLVNPENSFNGKLVILDVSSADAYNAGHIPGAQLWTNSGEERYEGPVLSSNMVLKGETMDALLCQYGIDENTTVVFAGGGNPARTYFMFRYWGFPREKLKVLNGNKAAWTAAGYELTKIVPDVVPSEFSVKNLQYNPNVRAALNELIIAAEEGSAVPLNTLTNNTEVEGGTTGIFNQPWDYCSGQTSYQIWPVDPAIGRTAAYTGYMKYADPACIKPPATSVLATNVGADRTIFQGTIKGGKHVGNALFYNGNANAPVKTAAEIKALLEGVGIDGSKPIITYCRAGNAASYGFFPIDAVLGWDVMVYDGSWSQWGSLTNATDVPHPDFALPAELSAWATDRLTYKNTDGVTVGDPIYNADAKNADDTNKYFIEKPTFKISEGVLSPDDYNANSIEIEDQEYFETPAAGGASDSVSGGGGGGC